MSQEDRNSFETLADIEDGGDADAPPGPAVEEMAEEATMEKVQGMLTELAASMNMVLKTTGDQGRETSELARQVTALTREPKGTVAKAEPGSSTNVRRMAKLTAEESKDAKEDLLDAKDAFKIYKSGLEDNVCSRIGDGSFFDARRTWVRMTSDFPIKTNLERRLMPLAFANDALRIFNEVASAELEKSADELWELLEARLCNGAHRKALQDRFFSMTWNERKESVAEYAERLRAASLALPTPIANDVLLNRFKAGLPQKLQDHAILVAGDFDEVVSAVSELSSAQQNTSKEPVRKVREEVAAIKTPCNPVLGQTDTMGDQRNRYASYTCHYCQKVGHISRFCNKKKADRAKEDAAKQGEEKGGLPGASGGKAPP